ncbi:MAG: hypothetical protein ABW128_06720 [Rhizorhabdus sp.]
MISGLSSNSVTSAGIFFAAVPAGTLLIEVQYSTQPDFMWCPSPVVRSSNLGGMTLNGLNQATPYYARARPISTSGVEGEWTETFGFATQAGPARVLTPATVMIEPAMIVPREPVLSWTADNEVAGYPARALGRDDPNSMWWADLSGGKFAFNAYVAGGLVDTIAVLETNASEGMQITVKADYEGDTINTGSPMYQYGPVPFRASQNLPGRRGYHSLVRLPAPVAFRHYRIEITGQVPGNRFVATYAVIGLAHKTKNFALDKGETIADYGSIERDRSGAPNRVRGHRGRLVDFEVVNMTEAQYETAFERLRWQLGTTDPALVVPNSKPGAFLHDRILFGQVRAGRAGQPYSTLFSQAFNVDSLI